MARQKTDRQSEKFDRNLRRIFPPSRRKRSRVAQFELQNASSYASTIQKLTIVDRVVLITIIVTPGPVLL